MIHLRVPAKRLLVGDRCTGSGALVVTPPVPATPGKVAVTVRYTLRDGTTRDRNAVWGARTAIGVNRPDLTANPKGDA